jgi:predicted dehydrogenase
MNPIHILVIGTGMYTCGRGTEGYGTILPAVFEWKRKNPEGEIYVAGTSPESICMAQAKIRDLTRNMQVEPSIRFFPEGTQPDPNCYREAIRQIPRPACAIIATPDHWHRQMAGAAIEAGLHTQVVKPLAPTQKEVRELIELQKKYKTYCVVDFHKRFDLANLKLKDALSAGLIGDLLYIVVLYSQRKSVPSIQFRKWVEKTTIFQYLGIHYIDIIYFSTQATPLKVMAIGQKNWLSAQGIDTYDSVQGAIEWQLPSGKKFTQFIFTNWIDPESTSALSEQNIRIIGTKGRFESNQKNRGVTMVTDQKGIEEINPYFTSPYQVDGRVTFRGYGVDSIETFLNDVVQVENGGVKIEDLEKKRSTFKQSVIPTAILEGIHQSLQKNGEWIPIKTIPD